MNLQNEMVIERIKNAVHKGVKAKAISESTGITYFRISSVINTKSYRYSTTFSDKEIAKINKALDQIKVSL